LSLIYFFSRELQEFQRSEQELQQFFGLYGPSVHDSFTSYAALPDYYIFVENRIKAMSWATLTTALQTGAQTLGPDEGSHKVTLIGPDPANRQIHLPRITTKHVAAQRDMKEPWRNVHNLYRTMRLDSKTKAGAGWFLELPFRALCVKGATFQLHPMHLKPGGRTKDTFIHSRYTNKNLILPQQKLIVYDRNHPIETLQHGHYYQPRFQASCFF
jgi:hypothetical protein